MILSFARMILWRQVKLKSYRAIEKDDITDEKVDRKKIYRESGGKNPGNKQHVWEGIRNID